MGYKDQRERRKAFHGKVERAVSAVVSDEDVDKEKVVDDLKDVVDDVLESQDENDEVTYDDQSTTDDDVSDDVVVEEFLVEEVDPETKEEEVEVVELTLDQPLEDMTYEELRDVASELKIRGRSSMDKDDLLAAIKQLR